MQILAGQELLPDRKTQPVTTTLPRTITAQKGFRYPANIGDRRRWNLIVPTGLRLGWNLALPKMQNNSRRNRNRPLTRCRSQVTSPGGTSSWSIRVDLCPSVVSTSATSNTPIRLEPHRPHRLAARVEPRPPKNAEQYAQESQPTANALSLTSHKSGWNIVVVHPC